MGVPIYEERDLSNHREGEAAKIDFRDNRVVWVVEPREYCKSIASDIKLLLVIDQNSTVSRHAAVYICIQLLTNHVLINM